MNTLRALWGSLLGLSWLMAGCGESPEVAPAQSPPAPGATQVAARTVDVSRLNAGLLSAIRERDAAKVQSLLAQGAEPKAQTKWGKPALHLACEQGNLAIVQTLLDKGADLHAQIATRYSDDGVGYDGALAGSPLTYAAAAGHADIVRWLLDQGAGVNTPTVEQRTPLMYAVAPDLPSTGHVACVQLLLERGAEVHTPVPQGRGILTLARAISFVPSQTDEHEAQRQIVEILTRAGARP